MDRLATMTWTDGRWLLVVSCWLVILSFLLFWGGHFRYADVASRLKKAFAGYPFAYRTPGLWTSVTAPLPGNVGLEGQGHGHRFSSVGVGRTPMRP